MVEKAPQIPQCCAVNGGLLRTVHSTTGTGFEHPLGYLKKRCLMILFQAAVIEGLSTLYQCSMDPDRTPIPRMPRITNLSYFSTMVLDCRLVLPLPDTPCPGQGRAGTAGCHETREDYRHSPDGWVAPPLRAGGGIGGEDCRWPLSTGRRLY
jgi:hypothetical protein